MLELRGDCSTRVNYEWIKVKNPRLDPLPTGFPGLRFIYSARVCQKYDVLQEDGPGGEVQMGDVSRCCPSAP